MVFTALHPQEQRHLRSSNKKWAAKSTEFSRKTKVRIILPSISHRKKENLIYISVIAEILGAKKKAYADLARQINFTKSEIDSSVSKLSQMRTDREAEGKILLAQF